jgi:hypothetical protein
MMCYPPEIIEYIVEMTNLNPPESSNQQCLHTRAKDWHPTSAGEIYTYIAMRLYMTMYVENEITDL